MRPEAAARDRQGRDMDSVSQASRASQKKPYQVLVANYGSFYLRMGAVRESLCSDLLFKLRGDIRIMCINVLLVIVKG